MHNTTREKVSVELMKLVVHNDKKKKKTPCVSLKSARRVKNDFVVLW